MTRGDTIPATCAWMPFALPVLRQAREVVLDSGRGGNIGRVALEPSDDVAIEGVGCMLFVILNRRHRECNFTGETSCSPSGRLQRFPFKWTIS